MRSNVEIENYTRHLQAFSSFEAFRATIFESEGHLELLDGLRSACWRILLLFHDLDRQSWRSSLAKSRSAYESLRSHYLRAIENPDEVDTDADPLSEQSESPWTALRKDEAIRQEIFQDVERCMPENTYFRQPETQDMLLNILFIYTKLNPDVGYRQGMHELLAPIVWVVERDATRLEDVEDDCMKELLNPVYVEHDTFALFAEVMRTAKSFYDPGHGSQPLPHGSRRSVENESAMLIRCKRIFSTLLPHFDPGLAAHLDDLQISPQLFLMRWIRLLFGREFPFGETLQVWDLLFAEDPSLELIDYICVAMILRIRWQLVNADANETLMLLMRYQSPEDPAGPRTFVMDARHLKGNQDSNAGNDIIKKYSGRVPPPFGRPAVRPVTPDISVSPSTITPRLSRARSPFVVSPVVPSAFGSLINDATRGVMERGEKWGFNQAIQSAVGEVKKNVQSLQSARSSPRTSFLGEASFHRNNRSSDVSGNIAANVLRKMTALEERNRQLAEMLEEAIGELWTFEKKASEKAEDRDDPVQALSMAVAKVQFVQVFLQDSTLPLPQEEKEEPPDVVNDAAVPVATNESEAERPPEPSFMPATEPRGSSSVNTPTMLASSPNPITIKPPPVNTPPPSLPTTSVSTQYATSTAMSGNSQTHLRPRIEHSNFSWMLGQAHEDRSDFVHASPFSPAEKRGQANEKGYLFGDDVDVVGEPTLVQKKGKLRKGSKGGKVHAVEVKRPEDIGLGDMGGGAPT